MYFSVPVVTGYRSRFTTIVDNNPITTVALTPSGVFNESTFFPPVLGWLRTATV